MNNPFVWKPGGDRRPRNINTVNTTTTKSGARRRQKQYTKQTHLSIIFFSAQSFGFVYFAESLNQHRSLKTRELYKKKFNSRFIRVATNTHIKIERPPNNILLGTTLHECVKKI